MNKLALAQAIGTTTAIIGALIGVVLVFIYVGFWWTLAYFGMGIVALLVLWAVIACTANFYEAYDKRLKSKRVSELT